MSNNHNFIMPSWLIPEHQATSESIFFNRREILKGMGLAGLATGASTLSLGTALAAEEDPSASLYPLKRNEKYKLEREVTPEEINTTYNNFYEFGSHKQISKAAQALQIRPWEIAIDGDVANPMKIGIDDLLKKMPLEERLYRHRCVEAWSMTVPWSGFELSALIKLVEPNSDAKFIRFETFDDESMAPGLRQTWYPWPYVEGISMAEGLNEMTFMVTGAYGKPVSKQMGAPLRLALPWKYGFKSIKSIKRISFVKDQPVSFWEQLAETEYGFWANVNPEIAHPRWSQATERVLETGDRIPTKLYNGYEEQVAHLYIDLQDVGERLYR